MTKDRFVPELWFSVLEDHLSHAPDSMLATELRDKVRAFVAAGNREAVAVWNFYKETLDLAVHSSGASGFVITLLDLERNIEPPHGALAQLDGTINNAPWRKEHAR